MSICSECESVLDIDVEEVDEGDVVTCDECGAEFEVVGAEPLELSKIDHEGYEIEDVPVRDEEDE